MKDNRPGTEEGRRERNQAAAQHTIAHPRTGAVDPKPRDSRPGPTERLDIPSDFLELPTCWDDPSDFRLEPMLFRLDAAFF